MDEKKVKAKEYNSKYYKTNRSAILQTKKEQRDEKSLEERQIELAEWRKKINDLLNPFNPFDYRRAPALQPMNPLDKSIHPKIEPSV